MRPIAQEVLLQQKIRGLDMKKPKTSDSSKSWALILTFLNFRLT